MSARTIARVSQAALAACTPTQRRVLVACFLSDPMRTNREVAQLLGMTERSVERHKAAAVSRIRQHMEDGFDG